MDESLALRSAYVAVPIESLRIGRPCFQRSCRFRGQSRWRRNVHQATFSVWRTSYPCSVLAHA